MLEDHCSDNCKFKLQGHINLQTGATPAVGASQKDKQFSKWVQWCWRAQSEYIHKKKRSRVVHNVLKTISNSYINTKPTETTRPKGAGVRFCDTITIATQIEDSYHISKVVIGKM